SSLNHLVGAGKQRLGNREAEGLGALEVDHQLELGGLLYRQIGRLGALQDLVDEHRRAPPYVVDVRPIGEQPARLDVLSEDIHRWEPALGRKFCEPLRVREKDAGRRNEKRAGPRADRRSQGVFDFARATDFEREQLPSPFPGGRLRCLPLYNARLIPEDGNRGRPWPELLEQLEPLSRRLRRLKAEAREVGPPLVAAPA